MSIQTYNKPIYLDDRYIEYDPATGKTTQTQGELNKRGVAMEFQINLKILSGRDQWRVRPCSFTIIGDSETGIDDKNVSTAIYGLIEAGSRMASNIAYLSKGVLVGFFAKLGKYRQDEMPINVPVGDNSFGTIVFNNEDGSALRNQECGRSYNLPMTPGSVAVRIPWFRDDLSRQDILSTLETWEYVQDGFTFSLGQVKFKDDAKVEMVALPCNNVKYIKAVEKSKALGQLLINNDEHLGITSDKVLSQEFNDFSEGVDDDTLNPSSGSGTVNP